MTAAFDIDGTLITYDNCGATVPRYKVIHLFHILESLGYELFVWSGGGVSYANQICQKLGLKARVVAKGSFIPDIAVDDEEVSLGKSNIQVPFEITSVE